MTRKAARFHSLKGEREDDQRNCSTAMPMAAASFSRVAFRRRFSPASICDKAAWVIPIRLATSF